MQKLVLYSTLALILFIACSKDKFQDKPTIEIKSINPTQVPEISGSYTEIEMEFTDKQGDVDSVFLYKQRLNAIQRPLLVNANTLVYKLPDFPEKSKGVIKLTLQHATELKAAVTPPTQIGAPNDKEPDTIVFKIVVKDKGGNYSDTTVTDKIVVERFN
jgi:hypothetical protein